MEHHEAFEVFSDLFMLTVSCLEAVANSTNDEWNRDMQSDAMFLLLAMSQFSSTVALVATQSVLAYTKVSVLSFKATMLMWLMPIAM